MCQSESLDWFSSGYHKDSVKAKHSGFISYGVNYHKTVSYDYTAYMSLKTCQLHTKLVAINPDKGL